MSFHRHCNTIFIDYLFVLCNLFEKALTTLLQAKENIGRCPPPRKKLKYDMLESQHAHSISDHFTSALYLANSIASLSLKSLQMI